MKKPAFAKLAALCLMLVPAPAKTEVTTGSGKGFVARKTCETPLRGPDWKTLYKVGELMWRDTSIIQRGAYPQRYLLTKDTTSGAVVVLDKDAHCTTTIAFSSSPVTVNEVSDPSAFSLIDPLVDQKTEQQVRERFETWMALCQGQPEMEKLDLGCVNPEKDEAGRCKRSSANADNDAL